MSCSRLVAAGFGLWALFGGVRSALAQQITMPTSDERTPEAEQTRAPHHLRSFAQLGTGLGLGLGGYWIFKKMDNRLGLRSESGGIEEHSIVDRAKDRPGVGVDPPTDQPDRAVASQALDAGGMDTAKKLAAGLCRPVHLRCDRRATRGICAIGEGNCVIVPAICPTLVVVAIGTGGSKDSVEIFFGDQQNI